MEEVWGSNPHSSTPRRAVLAAVREDVDATPPIQVIGGVASFPGERVPAGPGEPEGPGRPAGGLGRLFLMLGEPKAHEPDGKDTTWGRDRPRMTGWRRRLTVDGADHVSFTDCPLLTGRLGLGAGPLPGTRALEITRGYVGAFFDLHLRGRSRPLPDRPSPRYPEVRFWR